LANANKSTGRAEAAGVGERRDVGDSGKRVKPGDVGKWFERRAKKKAPRHETPKARPPLEGAAKPGKTAPDSQRTSPIAPQPTEPLHEPVVIMSEAHANSCLVKVGSPFPDMSLLDLQGQPQPISRFFGDRLTLVVFWTSRKPFACEQFCRLERETVQKYANRGLKAVAINVGDTPETVRELAEQCGATFSLLLDSRGEALAQVAASKLPRSYLINSQGRILWLDIEYSQGTCRELRNAIEYFSRGAS
jgi:peroxiredoxin